MADKELPLFVFGALKDPEVCVRLFGAAPVMVPAILHDYALRTNGARFFVVPCKGARVGGKLLKLSKDQLDVVDLWEIGGDTGPRRMVLAVHGHVTAPVWLYAWNGVIGVDVNPEKMAQAYDRAAALRAVDEFNLHRAPGVVT